MSELREAMVVGRKTLWHRRVKPSALGLTIFCAALGIGSFTGRTLLNAPTLARIVASLCVAAAVSFIVGFLLNRTPFARIGYLLAFFVLLTNTAFFALEAGLDFPWKMLTLAPGTVSVWMGVGVAVIAGGAFWLEDR